MSYKTDRIFGISPNCVFTLGLSIQITRSPIDWTNIYIGFFFWEISLCLKRKVKDE